jgi:hypothetical protein
MKKIVLTYGLISGAILSAMMLLTLPFMHSFGNETGMVIGYTTMVLAFLLIFFGVRSYRDHVGGGRVGFFKALAVGALIGLLASACYVATWEAIYFRGKNDFIEKYQAGELRRMRQGGASEAQLAAKQVEMAKFAEMYRNPVFNSAMTFMEPLPVAIVFALVSAGILSRRRKDAPQPAA